MNKDKGLRTVLWYVVLLAATCAAWFGLKYAIYGLAEPRSWDVFMVLVGVFTSRIIAAYIAGRS